MKDRKKDDAKSSGSKWDKKPEPKEKDIKDVEEEMKKRKERIEAWRNANKKTGERVLKGFICSFPSIFSLPLSSSVCNIILVETENFNF